MREDERCGVEGRIQMEKGDIYPSTEVKYHLLTSQPLMSSLLQVVHFTGLDPHVRERHRGASS